MKYLLALLFFVTTSDVLIAQNVHIGILYNYFPTIVDKSDINMGNNNIEYNLNLIGIDIRSKNQFLENISIGIILQYGKKNLLNYRSKSFNDFHTFDAFRDIQLFSLEVPVTYNYPFLNNVSFDFGLKCGVERLSLEDSFNLYTSFESEGLIIGNSFSNSCYEISYSPLFEMNYLVLNTYEILFGVEYKILDFSIKYENDNEELDSTPDPGPNVITANNPDYYYKIRFTGISFSLGIKYIL